MTVVASPADIRQLGWVAAGEGGAVPFRLLTACIAEGISRNAKPDLQGKRPG
jgi:hypothetical protein